MLTFAKSSLKLLSMLMPCNLEVAGNFSSSVNALNKICNHSVLDFLSLTFYSCYAFTL